MHVGFLWPGFPDYAAHCIRAFIERHPFEVSVIGTRPSVPLETMETSLGQKVHWIDGGNRNLRWKDLGLRIPDLLVQGGYAVPAFNALSAECRTRRAQVLLLADTRWRGSLRQRSLDPFRHRVLLRPKFDGVLVPGRSGLKHARTMGYQRRLSGMLGADPRIFGGGAPLHERSNIFLFVGRFEPEKNILRLIEAFLGVCDRLPGWSLRLCGAGSLKPHIPEHPAIDVRGFLQPTGVANELRRARCLVLPSISEAWGVVVHEAALCGCALALSQSVGSAIDLAFEDNAVLFPAKSIGEIQAGLCRIASWSKDDWVRAEEVSRNAALQFGPLKFASAIEQFINATTWQADPLE